MATTVTQATVGFIYALIDPLTGLLRYVGLSKNPDLRLKSHVSAALTGRTTGHAGDWIRSLLRKGVRPSIRIIQKLDYKFLPSAEVYWISYFRSVGCDLCNSTDGGEGTPNPSREARARMSKSAKARGPSFLGKRHSEETKRKISEMKIGCVGPNKGRTFGVDAIENMRLGNAYRAKPFIDQFNNYYASLSEASQKLGIYKANISRVLQGKRKQASGYHFAYVGGVPSRPL